MANEKSPSILVALLSLFVISSAALVDRTLEENAKGKTVVDATVEKIQRSGIFPHDYQWLRRLAFVTTRDQGTQSIRPPDDNYGGLWNVTETLYNQTMNPLALADQYELIQDYFNISWSETTWKDLRKPLYSGLAARLYLHSMFPGADFLPKTIADQATFWAYFYYLPVSWSESSFTVQVEEYEESISGFKTMLDLMIIMDRSNSSTGATAENFNAIKANVSSFVRLLPKENVRISLISFNDQPELGVAFGSSNTADAVAAALNKLEGPSGIADTNKALTYAAELFKNAPARGAGDTPYRAAVIFTEGRSTTGVTDVTLLEDLGVDTYAVGIHPNPNVDELTKLAGDDPSRMTTLDLTASNAFEALNELHKTLREKGNRVTQALSIDRAVSDSLRENEVRYYKASVPSEGLTILIDNLSGSVSGYYSLVEINPNSAVYDEMVDGKRGAFIGASEDEAVDIVYIGVQGTQDASNAYSITVVKGNQLRNGAGRGTTCEFFTVISFVLTTLIARNM